MPVWVTQKRRWQNGAKPGNCCGGAAHFPACGNWHWGGQPLPGNCLSGASQPQGNIKAAHGQQYHDVSRSRGRWSSSTVLRILEDERYIGSYVIGRRAVIEVGGTRSRMKDRDKWFIIPDHHPAIIEKELFEKVQAVQRRFSLPTRKIREYPLKGKVYSWLLRSCTFPHCSKEAVLYVPSFDCQRKQPLPYYTSGRCRAGRSGAYHIEKNSWKSCCLHMRTAPFTWTPPPLNAPNMRNSWKI